VTRLTLAGILALVLIACGDDGTPPADSGTPTDTGSDTGTADTGPGAGETISFVFYAADDESVIEGATVGFVEASGTQFEGVTDATGRVSFDNVTIESAAGYLTIAAEGFVLQSGVTRDVDMVRIRANDDRVPVFLRVPPERVTVSGTLTNVDDPTHYFNVSATGAAGQASQGLGPNYEVEVPVGVPFTLIATEFSFMNSAGEWNQTFYGTSIASSEAVTADTTLDIDMSVDVPYETATGTLPLTTPGHTLEDATPYIIVAGADPNIASFLGSPTLVTASADMMAWDYNVTWAAPTEVPEIQTRYLLSRAPLTSFVIVPGPPAGGTPDIVFLDSPEVAEPAFGAASPLHAPVRYAFDEDVFTVLDVLNEETDEFVWFVTAFNGVREIALPELPPSLNEDDYLPASGIIGRIRSCEVSTENDRFCQRIANSRIFDYER